MIKGYFRKIDFSDRAWSVPNFPERTRTRTDELSAFKPGGFAITIRVGTPIVPLGIAGAEEISPPDRLPGAGAAPLVVVGDPIPTTEWDRSQKDAPIAHVLTEIGRLRLMAGELPNQSPYFEQR